VKNQVYLLKKNDPVIFSGFLKLIKGAAPIVISKSDRHIIFGTVMPAPTCASFSSMILVEGKLLTLGLWKPESEALVGAVEITKWVEEIEKTTPAEAR
jgi:hypothetical protein